MKCRHAQPTGEKKMANYDNTDVSILWFKNLEGVRTRIYVKAGTMTRKQAGEVLDVICAAVEQGVGDCGYTCQCGGDVRWH